MSEPLISWLYGTVGVIACLAAALALLAQKGGMLHRLAGRLSFWSMLAAIAYAVWTSLSATENLTLLLALLAGYLLISGYRVLYLKRPVPRDTIGPARAGALDKGLAQFILIACCAMSAWGMMVVPLNVEAIKTMDIEPFLMIGIGLFGAMLALGDMKRFRRLPADPHHWLVLHVARMLAGITVGAIAISLDALTMFHEIARWATPATVGALAVASSVVILKRRIMREGDPRSYFTIRIAEPEPEQDDV